MDKFYGSTMNVMIQRMEEKNGGFSKSNELYSAQMFQAASKMAADSTHAHAQNSNEIDVCVSVYIICIYLSAPFERTTIEMYANLPKKMSFFRF